MICGPHVATRLKQKKTVNASNKVQPEVLRRRGTTEGVGSGTAAKGNGRGIKKGPGQDGAMAMKINGCWYLVSRNLEILNSKISWSA